MMRLAEPDEDGAYKTDDNEIAGRMPMFSMKQMRRALSLVAGVYDILFGMRRCRISLPNRCYHLISRVAHRGIGRGTPL